MKYQSAYNSEIFFEKIEDTPISYMESLRLNIILDIDGGGPYFFFSGWKKNKKRKSYISCYLKYRSLSPYRLMEEDVAHATVWNYLNARETYPASNKDHCRVYFLWGTPYIKEMNTRGTYSDYKQDIGNKVFQIMIITDDETLEIVDPHNMEWIKYNPKKMRDILTGFINNFEETLEKNKDNRLYSKKGNNITLVEDFNKLQGNVSFIGDDVEVKIIPGGDKAIKRMGGGSKLTTLEMQPKEKAKERVKVRYIP
jgi:hypothetical protein